jgi:DNA-binding PadR family transcriptional regulator
MTPVFGHGRLRLYLLKLLDESPRHGYEIIQQLRERFAGLYAPSAGTVYPRLARLESEGLVRHETDGGRKVYHITPAGQAELAAKAAELETLEAEIRDSVRGLAEGIRDEVRESARTVREELETQAREAQREARRGPQAERPGSGFPFSGMPPMPPMPPTPPGVPGPGYPFAGPGSAGPPPESATWDREQWREWKHAQQDQWREWRDEFRGQRDQWKDWQHQWKEQWKEQWKDQWKEQWEEQWEGIQTRGPAGTASILSWLSTLFAGFESPGPQDARPGDRPRDAPPPGAGPRSKRREEWEGIAPQLRDLFGSLRAEAGPLAEELRAHGPLKDDELAEVRGILLRALADVRRTLHEWQ